MKRHLMPCLIGIAVAIGVMLLLGRNTGTLGFGAVVLLCPLMMLLMMLLMSGVMGGMRGHGSQPEDDREDDSARV
jgi:hypothetical protein